MWSGTWGGMEGIPPLQGAAKSLQDFFKQAQVGSTKKVREPISICPASASKVFAKRGGMCHTS
jgi:hypothetical protein